MVFRISGVSAHNTRKYASIDEMEGKEDELKSKKRSAECSELACGPHAHKSGRATLTTRSDAAKETA